MNKRRPAPKHAGYYTLDEARLLFPDEATVYKSKHDNRWKASLPPSWAISRTWTAYGEELALFKCAAYIWEKHHAQGGEACPWPDIAATQWHL